MSDSHQRPGANGHHHPGMGADDITSLLTGRLRGPGTPPRPAEPPRTPPAQGTGPSASPASEVPEASPTAVPRLAGLPGELPVTWDVIEDLQKKVSDQLAAHDPNRMMEEEHRRAKARSLTTSVVADWAARYAQANTPLTPVQERDIATAVFDAMYRGGRLQALLDGDGVEDVMVDGTRAMVEYYDRPRRIIDHVADSHDELVAWVNRMAALSGHGERSLNQASPMATFRMPDGSRVTASLLTTRPSVVIRKHRIQQHGIADLVRWGTLNPLLERFLVACLYARQNILIVGDMGAGKTTLLRALGREIPEHERLTTIESDRELYLDEPGRGPATLAFEARQSNGERDAAGEMTIADIFPFALRYNGTRVIVGEVRSKEIKPMLQSMSASGSGSMCTIHARRPHATISRLVQLCTEAGMATEAAYHLIASAVDVVVYITYLDETGIGGRKHRYLSHIYEVHDVVGEGGRPTTTEVFAPTPTEPRAVFNTMPSFIDDLERTGSFDRHWLTEAPHAAWGAPMETVTRAGGAR